ncbi:sialin-like [Melitaea cinxia]|uniref:sialin-like n=1 Tax=Melitaea cinxia TaxID=113334 RepID=UPI001E271373|nr:sialin-like [Melitaea cinxia]
MSETDYKKVPIDEIEKNGISCDLPEEEPAKYGYGIRHVQSFLFFMCITLGYLSRGHLGVTIVAMTMGKHIDERVTAAVGDINNSTMINSTSKIDDIANFTAFEDISNNSSLVSNHTNLDYNTIYRTYDWPKSTQEMVLGSFFLGYSIMMLPMGIICQKWGGKIPLQVAMFVNALVSLIAPWCVAWGGWKTLSAFRLLQGLSQAGLYPAVQTLLSNWIPSNERASISSYVYTASGVGTVIAFQLGGILAYSRFEWPSTFWVTGVLCFIGLILITVFGATSPKDHKSISDGEKAYILGKAENRTETKAKVPWKAVLKSVPLWATMTAHIGLGICFLFFFVQVPTYMYAVLKLNIRNVIFFFIASVIPAICLTWSVYTTNTVLAVTLFVLYMSATAAMNSSVLVNYMDLAPNYSGVIMATGNTMMTIVSLGTPVVTSLVVTDIVSTLNHIPPRHYIMSFESSLIMNRQYDVIQDERKSTDVVQ